MSNLPALSVMLPLGFALLALLFPRRAQLLGIIGLLLTLAASAWLAWRVATEGPLLDYGIEYYRYRS